MNRWIKYNPNPFKKVANDCSIRALCKALNKPWDYVYFMVCMAGFKKKDMPSTNDIWDDVLEWEGFERTELYEDLDVKGFCEVYTRGIYVLCLDGHVVTAEDGYYYDVWDSGEKRVRHYWKR